MSTEAAKSGEEGVTSLSLFKVTSHAIVTILPLCNSRSVILSRSVFWLVFIFRFELCTLK